MAFLQTGIAETENMYLYFSKNLVCVSMKSDMNINRKVFIFNHCHIKFYSLSFLICNTALIMAHCSLSVMCVCVCVFMYVCTHVCIYICMYVYMYVCIYLFIYLYFIFHGSFGINPI